MKSTRAGEGAIKSEEEKRQYEQNADTRMSRDFRRRIDRIDREFKNERKRARERGDPALPEDGAD